MLVDCVEVVDCVPAVDVDVCPKAIVESIVHKEHANNSENPRTRTRLENFDLFPCILNRYRAPAC